VGTSAAAQPFIITVNPLVFTSISTFLAQPDSETTFYYIKGVIIFLQLQNDMLMISDGTGIIYVNTSINTWLVGDEIVAYGVKTSQVTPGGFMVFLVNDPTKTIILNLSSNNVMPLVPVAKTIVEFLALDHHDSANHFAYIKLSGTLQEQDGNLYLTDGTHNVGIYAPTGTAEHDALSLFVGSDIYLCGLSIIGGTVEDPNIYFVFINYPGDVTLMPV
jgi:hypothetical protein